MPALVKFAAFWNNEIFTEPPATRSAVVTLLAAIKTGFAGFPALAVVANDF